MNVDPLEILKTDSLDERRRKIGLTHISRGRMAKRWEWDGLSKEDREKAYEYNTAEDAAHHDDKRAKESEAMAF